MEGCWIKKQALKSQTSYYSLKNFLTSGYGNKAEAAETSQSQSKYKNQYINPLPINKKSVYCPIFTILVSNFSAYF